MALPPVPRKDPVTDQNGTPTQSWDRWLELLRTQLNAASSAGAVASVNGKTGIVVLTKSDVSLSNVDNTSDALKPVSAAQQAALDLKANLASPTFTGTVTSPTFSGALTGNVTGNVSGSSGSFTGSLSGDVTGTQSATAISAATVTGKALTGYSAAAGTITATDTILSAIGKNAANDALKAPLASPTFTGTVTAPTFSGALTGNVTGNVTGSAGSFTGSLSGDVTGTQSATAISAATVTGKAITGYVSGSGTVGATDTILQAIQKLDGNTSLKSPIASPTFTGTPAAPTAIAGTSTTQLATTAFVQGQGFVTASTAPVTSVASKTGAVTLAKADVGLNLVDNTSDATKNTAVATLTNKTLTSPVLNTPTADTITGIAAAALTIQPAAGQNLALNSNGAGLISHDNLTFKTNTIASSSGAITINPIANSNLFLNGSGTGNIQLMRAGVAVVTVDTAGVTLASGKTIGIGTGTVALNTTGAITVPSTTDTLVGKATTDTLTNKTIAAGSNTISGITNANLSGSAGITIANGGTGASTKAAAFDALSPMTAAGDLIYGGTAGTGTVLAKGVDGLYLKLSGGVPTWAAGGTPTYTKPTVQKFTSGSGNYTTPAGVLYIKVKAVGSGAGGQGSGTTAGTTPGAGSATTFGTSLISAGGGVQGAFTGGGGAGGTGSLGTAIGFAVTGGTGGGTMLSANNAVVPIGSFGGASPVFGGAGAPAGISAAGGAGVANTGGGGAGGACTTSVAGNNWNGSGGGSGAYVEGIIYPTASQVFAYSVAAGGAAGGAGASGFAGGAGGSGVIIVEEYYQ